MRTFLALLGTVTALLPIAGCAARAKKDNEASELSVQIAADSFRTRKNEAAIAELQKALTLDPENPDAYNLQGVISLAQGAEYIRQVEVEACLSGEDAASVRRDAEAKFRDAERSLKRAVALRADFSEAWNNLAVAMLQLQDYDQAAEAARSALKNPVYPDPEYARANLGWAYFMKHDLQAAWKELHEAAETPGFCVGQYRLAKVYMERGSVDDAAVEIDGVVADPRCPIQEAFLLAGLVHDRRHEADKARQMFNRCLSLAPRGCMAAECKRYGDMIQ